MKELNFKDWLTISGIDTKIFWNKSIEKKYRFGWELLHKSWVRDSITASNNGTPIIFGFGGINEDIRRTKL